PAVPGRCARCQNGCPPDTGRHLRTCGVGPPGPGHPVSWRAGPGRLRAARWGGRAGRLGRLAGLGSRRSPLIFGLRQRTRPGVDQPYGAPCQGLAEADRAQQSDTADGGQAGSEGSGYMIKVLLAEDMHMVRGALVALLDLEPDIQVVAEVASGDEII